MANGITSRGSGLYDVSGPGETWEPSESLAKAKAGKIGYYGDVPNDIINEKTPPSPTSSRQESEYSGVVSQSGIGRPDSAISDVYLGFDHRHAGAAYQKNTDHHGLTFFTRPMLNLSYNNIMGNRKLMALLNSDPLSMWAAIRAILDPGYPTASTRQDASGSHAPNSALVDEKNPFIPILTNTLLNVSGFPDITLDTYTSPEGIRKESYSIVDSVAEANSAFTLQASFANIKGDPVTNLFDIWTTYAGSVYMGDMVPYPRMVIENRIDYQTRIWRLVLDSSKTYVKKIGTAHASVPLAAPYGAAMSYASDVPYNASNDQVTIPFQCQGAEYMDPILYHEFNSLVTHRNQPLYESVQGRSTDYVRIPSHQVNGLNFYGYPWIDVETLELQWWISKEEYNELIGESNGNA